MGYKRSWGYKASGNSGTGKKRGKGADSMELGRYGDEEMRKNRAESGVKLARTASAKGWLHGLGSWRGRRKPK